MNLKVPCVFYFVGKLAGSLIYFAAATFSGKTNTITPRYCVSAAKACVRRKARGD